MPGKTRGLINVWSAATVALAGIIAVGNGRLAAAQGDAPAGVPPVLLSDGHAKLCKVDVGDSFPAISLPQASGGSASLDEIAGKRATVVLFWTPDRWMSRAALGDLAKDISAEQLAAGVALVGVAVGQDGGAVQAEIDKAGAKFTQWLDADGKAFAQVGSVALPRLYVLDAERRIVWFDVEYSEATRRELRQALAALRAAR